MATATQLRRLDFNIPPRSGLSKGRRLRDMFAEWGTTSTYAEDATIPLWLVGSDVATGAEVVITRACSPTRCAPA